MSKIMIDLIDTQLISLLEQDATQTSEKMAKQLNTSSSTIRRRITNLIKRGVIRIIAIPDPNKIGRSVMAVIEFELSHEHAVSFSKTLASWEGVKCLYVTTGRVDAFAIVWFASQEELTTFLKGTIKVEGVKNQEVFFCLHIEKIF